MASAPLYLYVTVLVLALARTRSLVAIPTPEQTTDSPVPYPPDVYFVELFTNPSLPQWNTTLLTTGARKCNTGQLSIIYEGEQCPPYVLNLTTPYGEIVGGVNFVSFESVAPRWGPCAWIGYGRSSPFPSGDWLFHLNVSFTAGGSIGGGIMLLNSSDLTAPLPTRWTDPEFFWIAATYIDLYVNWFNWTYPKDGWSVGKYDSLPHTWDLYFSTANSSYLLILDGNSSAPIFPWSFSTWRPNTIMLGDSICDGGDQIPYSLSSFKLYELVIYSTLDPPMTVPPATLPTTPPPTTPPVSTATLSSLTPSTSTSPPPPQIPSGSTIMPPSLTPTVSNAPSPNPWYCGLPSNPPCLPNWQLLGQGFDVTTLEYGTGQAILNLTWGTLSPFLSGYGYYALPLGTSLIFEDKQSLSVTKVASSEALELLMSSSLGLPESSVGVGGSAASVLNNLNMLYTEDIYVQTNSFTAFGIVTPTYSLDSGAAIFTDSFLRSLNALPTTYNNDTKPYYHAWITNWGTHMTYALSYGCLAKITTRLTRCDYVSKNDVKLQSDLVDRWMNISGQVSNSGVNFTTSFGSVVKAETFFEDTTIEAIGGDTRLCQSLTNCAWQAYLASLNAATLSVIKQQVVPIYSLPIPTQYQISMKLAITDYQDAVTLIPVRPKKCSGRNNALKYLWPGLVAILGGILLGFVAGIVKRMRNAQQPPGGQAAPPPPVVHAGQAGQAAPQPPAGLNVAQPIELPVLELPPHETQPLLRQFRRSTIN